MKKFIKPILLVIIYMIMQAVVGGIIGIVLAATNPDFGQALSAGDKAAAMNAFPASWMAMGVLISGIITVLIGSAMKLINWKTVFTWNKAQASTSWLPLIAAIAGIFAINVFEEQLQLDNIMEEQFTAMMNSTLGVLSICLFAPIIEELCFREAVMGSLLRKGANPWTAIIFSAIVFGLIHANPVQIVGAGLMGIILGIIYYKSGNIVLTTILHVLNNSTATFLTITCGSDATTSDLVGGTTIAITSATICATFCVAMLIRYWKHC